MADFDKALESLLEDEGGWVDDPADKGGETYCGISRQYHPDWDGWTIVDTCLLSEEFSVCLKRNNELQWKVRFFYKRYFWELFWGDRIRDEGLATRLLSIAVNMGVTRAILFLQQALNVLERDESFDKDILEDGVYGSLTNGALGRCSDKDYLLKILTIFQGAHYLDNVRKVPSQKRFIRGWINRLKMEVE